MKGWMGVYKCQLSVKILENFQAKTKSEKPKDYCKADHNNVYFFLITIFRQAIPAFFRFTDATEFMIGVTIFYKWRMSQEKLVQIFLFLMS